VEQSAGGNRWQQLQHQSQQAVTLTITVIFKMIKIKNKLVVMAKETASGCWVSVGGCVSIVISKNNNQPVVTATATMTATAKKNHRSTINQWLWQQRQKADGHQKGNNPLGAVTATSASCNGHIEMYSIIIKSIISWWQSAVEAMLVLVSGYCKLVTNNIKRQQ